MLHFGKTQSCLSVAVYKQEAYKSIRSCWPGPKCSFLSLRKELFHTVLWILCSEINSASGKGVSVAEGPVLKATTVSNVSHPRLRKQRNKEWKYQHSGLDGKGIQMVLHLSAELLFTDGLREKCSLNFQLGLKEPFYEVFSDGVVHTLTLVLWLWITILAIQAKACEHFHFVYMCLLWKWSPIWWLLLLEASWWFYPICSLSSVNSTVHSTASLTPNFVILNCVFSIDLVPWALWNQRFGF